MPLPKGAKVLGQKREGTKLVLYYKDTKGKIHKDIRKCKCPKNTNKKCSC